MPQAMIWSSLKKGRADTRAIRDLYDCHVSLPTKRSVRILSGTKARKWIEKQVHEAVATTVTGSEFRGTSACTGRAKGIVRVINTPDDMGKMRAGDILVSVATTPSIVSAMRKAAAILTDEGGLTCHAAIVSRELGIPCVVGLGTITSTLKDGDLVEVDAKKGVVKIK